MTTIEVSEVSEVFSQQLDQISRELHRLVPVGVCVHGDAFCLSCGLDWLVEQSVSIRLESREQEP